MGDFLIDGHTHLQMDEFRDIIPDIVKEMHLHNIGAVCNVGYDIESSKALLSFGLEGIDTFAFAGIHPHYADKINISDIDVIKQLLKSGKYNGMGEIGLDRYWHKDELFIDKQKQIFRKQLEIAEELNIPVMLHIRDAYEEALDIITDYKLKRVEFHSFTGNEIQLEKIYSMGYFFGINGVITFRNSRLKDIVKQDYFDRMILETDAPYLTPVPKRGKRNRSDYIFYIYDFIANHYEMDRDTLITMIYNNFMEFIGNE